MVKRAGNLIVRIADPENLRLAFYKAARGKQDRAEVRCYGEHLHDNLAELRHQLETGGIEVGNHRYFMVYEPKERSICAAPFAERVLHHALMNVLEPVFERYSIDDSYACRKGKGGQAALQRARFFAGRHRWFLKLDIRKYFDSIDHQVLLQLLRRRIKDGQVIDIFAQLIKGYSTAPGKGMPIGSLVSQHCANLYLGALDHKIKDDWGVKGYVRYMDDFILFGQSRRKLKAMLGQAACFLENALDLELHDRQILNRCAGGIPYLGFRVFPGRIALGHAAKSRFSRKFRKYERKYIRGEWDIDTLNQHMLPLIGFTRSASAAGWRREVMAHHGALSVEG